MPETKSPWWWRLLGASFVLLGIGLLPAPQYLGPAVFQARFAFYGGALVLIALGAAFLKLAPAPSVIRCPQCRHDTDRRRGLYYCPECGHVLEPEEDDLKPSEINCPFCLEPIPKKSGLCPQCSKTLPTFGVYTVKNRPSCRWCKTPIQTGQKFCRYCSAPLASGVH